MERAPCSMESDSQLASPFPPEINGLPLAPIERFLHRNDAPKHPMVFRVLMRFDGPYQQDKLTAAFQMAIARQPLLTSVVVGLDKGSKWELSSAIPQLEWQAAGQDPEEIRLIPIDYLDLSKSPGVHCRIFPVDSGVIILLDIHHVCCDGQGARQLLSEWFGIYQQLLHSDQVKLATLDFLKLKERDQYRTMNPPIGTWEGLRNLYLTVRGRTVRIPERFPNSQTSDFLCEHSLTVEETAGVRQGLKNQQFSINDVGLAATFATFTEQFPEESRRGYMTLMHPVDLRWPSDLRTPACNRVGVSFLRRKKWECQDFPRLLDSLRDQMKYVKQRYVGAEFLRGLAAADGLPGGTKRIQSWGWFVPTVQFTCLGDTTRAMHYRFNQVDGMINFGGLQLERISGFMQLGPFLPISLAACETNQRLTLTARVSSRHFDRSQAERFLASFVDKIMQMRAMK